MEEQHPHNILIFKRLSGDLSPEEEGLFDALLKQSPEFEMLFKEYQKTWELSGTEWPEAVSSIDLEAEWETFKKGNELDAKVINIRKRSPYYAMKIAAAILIFVFIGAGALYTFTPKKQTLISENLVKETELPDGTMITMNKHSKITYTNLYNKKERSVNLEGDAYFKVEKDPEKPFIIHAESFYVEVLGTQFYVNANEHQRKVVVTEGTVAVWQKEDQSDRMILSSGEELVLDKEKAGVKNAVPSNPNYLSWKTKVFAFKDQSLEDVCKELEKVYNVTFKFENEDLKTCRLSVSFENQEINEILNVLTATFEQVTFKQDNTTITIDGKACY
jgi:ferric-dicitrate binding protein FerR (iron transport regulator)